MRIVFFSDLHGSTLVFQKGLRLAVDYEADLIILGGDLTGKRCVPIRRIEEGSFLVAEPYLAKDKAGNTVIASKPKRVDAAGLPLFLKRLEAKGYYWRFEDDARPDGEADSPSDPQAWERAAWVQRLVKWADLANARMPEGVECVWTGGNDDEQATLDDLRKQDLGRLVYVEDRLYDIGDYQILSLGVSNYTPFETPRECSEPEIATRLASLAQAVRDPDHLLLNVHVPPVDCGELDAVLDLHNPNRLLHVGSTAVRSFIEDRQPLAAFVGHIHERTGAARIGRTMIFNPGSEYSAGILRAFIVDLEGPRVQDYLRVTQ